MANLTGDERATYVQGMFSRIANKYDLLNRLMTGGQDVRWRNLLLKKAALTPGDRVLDIGAGTGDIALTILEKYPEAWPVAADFTEAMMRVGQTRAGGEKLDWCSADALRLPFAGECFDAAVSGFLMRNVSDLPKTLSEHYRVLKPGGRIVILDTTRPPKNLITPFMQFHLNVIIPTLGRLIAQNEDAYGYLTASTKGFVQAEDLAARMVHAGFRDVAFRRLMLGAVAVHWGVK